MWLADWWRGWEVASIVWGFACLDGRHPEVGGRAGGRGGVCVASAHLAGCLGRLARGLHGQLVLVGLLAVGQLGACECGAVGYTMRVSGWTINPHQLRSPVH